MKKSIKTILKISSILALISSINGIIKKDSDLSIFKNLLESGNTYYNTKYGQIYYKKYEGGTNKPKVLMLHSLTVGGSHKEFDKLIEKFESQYEVYAIDMLGFGHSDKPSINYNSYLYTSLINEFIKNVIDDKVTVVASGLCADYAFIARELNPQYIDKLFLINPYSFKSTDFYGNSVSKITKKVINLPIIGTFITNVLSTKFVLKKYLISTCYYNHNIVNDKLVREHFYNAHYNCDNNRYVLSHLVTNFLKVDAREKIVTTDKETTIILSENCDSFDCFNIQEILMDNKNIKTVVVPLSRQLVSKEKPTDVYKIVIDNL